MASLVEVSSSKIAGGLQKVFSHISSKCNSRMNFAMFIPPKALRFYNDKQSSSESSTKFPVLYWLSGRGCNEEDFLMIDAIQKNAAEHNLIVVGPDTSPRNVLDGEDDNMYIGAGASYYVDATSDKWSKHYQMFSYVTDELIKTVESNFSFVDTARRGIFGHSMGGHGALIAVLKKPNLYSSVSAFAPVANAIANERMQYVYGQYFGQNEEVWRQWDATELVKGYDGPNLDILIDQGAQDELLNFLLPWKFVEAAEAVKDKVAVKLRMRDGYDHGWILSDDFIGEHFAHHAKVLNA